MQRSILPFLTLVISFMYSVALFHYSKTGDSVVTILFLIGTLLLITKNVFLTLKATDGESDVYSFKVSCFYLWATHLGILAGAYITNASADNFWVPDAINVHVPQAKQMANFYLGKPSNITYALTRSGVVSHSWVGLFFIIKQNYIASTIALTILKMIACLYLYALAKKIFNEKIAFLSTVIYIFAPTSLLYSLYFYKESMVQMLLIISFYYIYSTIFENKFVYFIHLSIALTLLYFERKYLPPLLITTTITAIILKYRNSKFVITTSIVIAVIGIITLAIFNSSLVQGYNYVLILRERHSQYSDIISKYNYDIPYIFALAKIIFTPFFTFSKFKIFYNLSYLLIWGSFVNQIFIFIYIIGLLRNFTKNFVLHITLNIPFFIFIFFAAYISPWAGRIRDSFYPIFALYIAQFLYEQYNARVKFMAIHNRVK